MLCPHPMSLNGRSTVPILSRPQQARPPAQRVRSPARMRQDARRSPGPSGEIDASSTKGTLVAVSAGTATQADLWRRFNVNQATISLVQLETRGCPARCVLGRGLDAPSPAPCVWYGLGRRCCRAVAGGAEDGRYRRARWAGPGSTAGRRGVAERP